MQRFQLFRFGRKCCRKCSCGDGLACRSIVITTFYRTQDQLKKKVKDYMALAEVQYERGLVDKAIEMNVAAWNFCKINRICCFMEELHLQKRKLIDAKLKERIESIEKGDIFLASLRVLL